jgi:hypothetical protein
MRIHRPITAVLGLALFFAQAGVASAGATVNTRFKTDLDACCAAPSEDNDGDAEYRKQEKNSVTRDERFGARAKIELPSAALGIADAAAAAAADIRIILTRSAVDYAECSLPLWEIEQDFEIENGSHVLKEEAEFRVSVRNTLKKGSPILQELVGACDIDLATPGVQGGVPAVQAGDTATVVLVDPSEASSPPASRTLDKDFLQGTF